MILALRRAVCMLLRSSKVPGFWSRSSRETRAAVSNTGQRWKGLLVNRCAFTLTFSPHNKLLSTSVDRVTIPRKDGWRRHHW